MLLDKDSKLLDIFVADGKTRFSWSNINSWNFRDIAKKNDKFTCNACWCESRLFGFFETNQNLINGNLFHETIEKAFTTGEILYPKIVYEAQGWQHAREIDCIDAVQWLKDYGIDKDCTFEEWVNLPLKDFEDFFEVVGRYDCLKGNLLIDFKTTSKKQKAKFSEKYNAQLQLYAYILNESGVLVENVALLYPEYEVAEVRGYNEAVGKFWFDRFSNFVRQLAVTSLGEVFEEIQYMCDMHSNYKIMGYRLEDFFRKGEE